MKTVKLFLFLFFLVLLTACTTAGARLSTKEKIEQLLAEDPDFFEMVWQTPGVTQPAAEKNSGNGIENTGGSDINKQINNQTQCIQNQKISSSCSSCKIATVVRVNSNCTTFAQKETDLSCTAGCSKPGITNPPANSLSPDISGTACCKICTKGKACGDKCISENAVCNKSPGCACNP